MEEQKISIPLKMAKILVSYFAFTATEQERDTLDEWINESDSNMQVFEDCLELVEYRPKWINPFKDDYTPPEYWIIADYFTKYTNKTISEFEENCLAEWRSAQEQNDQFFNDRPATTDRLKMFYWLMVQDWKYRKEFEIMS